MKEFFENYGGGLFLVGFIISCFIILFIVCGRDNAIKEQVYNSLMSEEYEFIDNTITHYSSKYQSRIIYKVIYRDSEGLKEIDLTSSQYYSIVDKFKYSKQEVD